MRGHATRLPRSGPMSEPILLRDAEATLRAGAAAARRLEGGMVITLRGDLGAGKTTLVRGMLRGLGWTGPVKSPTYGLVEHYLFSSLYFYHFDFYRFNDADEWETAGLAECFRDDSLCVIEWPERVSGLLPPADLALSLEIDGDARRLFAAASSGAGERCERAIREAFATG
jgi:tRNA threonylcarbamoyladenosine biosynthesis protein TsaE